MPKWFWQTPHEANGHAVPAPAPEPSPLPPALSPAPSSPPALKTWKLSRAQQIRVCEWLGQHYNTE